MPALSEDRYDPAAGVVERDRVPDRFKWDLTNIFTDWAAWQSAYDQLDRHITTFATLRGTLSEGARRLLDALQLRDDIGQLGYRVYYFTALAYDQDQRDNALNARRQQVQILFARAGETSAWFDPEVLSLGLPTVQAWMAADPGLATYRFALEDLFRQQAHILDAKGEHLLSLSSRLSASASESYAALSTADAVPPVVRLTDGTEVTLTYGQYQALLSTNRSQKDRAIAFEAFHGVYQTSVNTYASLYNGVLQRDWFYTQARGYPSSLEAALHGDNVPPAVVLNLIETTKAAIEPFRRYHRLRRRVLGLETYHVYDTSVPLIDFRRSYTYDEVLEWLPASTRALGPAYQRQLDEILKGRCIDVYENRGKRDGAYSAPVYGARPYVLLNFNNTIDAAFTLAHELGHSMHTALAHANQPFVYASYPIFVAEVPSTLSEALLLDHLLARTTDERERIVLLQHAIDGIVGTFYAQVLFADFEWQAHRLVEQGLPITSDTLGDVYFGLLEAYYGDTIVRDEPSRVTWARIPHFFETPYYVYQYATCFASSARLHDEFKRESGEGRAAVVDRYLTLLKSGGSDHPMALLKRAGIDLSRPETVQAVVDQLDRLVSELERAIARL